VTDGPGGLVLSSTRLAQLSQYDDSDLRLAVLPLSPSPSHWHTGSRQEGRARRPASRSRLTRRAAVTDVSLTELVRTTTAAAVAHGAARSAQRRSRSGNLRLPRPSRLTGSPARSATLSVRVTGTDSAQLTPLTPSLSLRLPRGHPDHGRRGRRTAEHRPCATATRH
jgi:hypothetical protein